MEGFAGVLYFLYFALGLYFLVCVIRIAQNAGYSGWFGVLMLVPVVNLFVLGRFAFETWPLLKTKEEVADEKIAKLRDELVDLIGEKEATKRLARTIGEGDTRASDERGISAKEKLRKARELVDRDVYERKQRGELIASPTDTPGICPYCGGAAASQHLIEGPLSARDREHYGYYYKWDCQCPDCGKKWFSTES